MSIKHNKYLHAGKALIVRKHFQQSIARIFQIGCPAKTPALAMLQSYCSHRQTAHPRAVSYLADFGAAAPPHTLTRRPQPKHSVSSIGPSIGSLTRKSHFSLISRPIPLLSLPITTASGISKLHLEAYTSCVAPTSAPAIQMPASFSLSIV